MLEFIFMAGVTKPPIPVSPPIFLYDPLTGKDLIADNATEVVNANTTADPTRLLHGYGTKKFSATNSGATITFKTPINMDIPEWTIEYDVVGDVFPVGSAYQNDLYFYTTGSNYIWSIWGDNGWNNQMQVFTGPWYNSAATDNTNTYRFGPSKSGENGIARRIAMVLKNGQITVYKNGARMALVADLTGKDNPTVLSYPKRTTGSITKVLIGYINANFPTYTGAFGRLAIYNYAKYSGDTHTVGPIE